MAQNVAPKHTLIKKQLNLLVTIYAAIMYNTYFKAGVFLSNLQLQLLALANMCLQMLTTSAINTPYNVISLIITAYIYLKINFEVIISPKNYRYWIHCVCAFYTYIYVHVDICLCMYLYVYLLVYIHIRDIYTLYRIYFLSAN